MGRFSQVRNIPGVYVLIDLDDQPLDVGQSKTLRSRLEQHFVRQDSSATADGLLDIFDVLRVAVWYAADDRVVLVPIRDLLNDEVPPLTR